MMGKAAQNNQLRQVFSLFENSTPQLYLDIDRVKAQMLGVNISEVFTSLQTYLGSSYVNDFNLLGRTFRVTAQADAPFRMDPSDVLKLRVRNSSGGTVPLGSFTTVSDVSAPSRVPRYNLFPAAELDGAAAPGFSQGQAIDAMQQIAKETLPQGFSYEWTELAFQQIRAGNAAVFAFALGVAFVFLVLAAQFESLTLPHRDNPDRADEPRCLDHGRDPARPGQQHPHPGRLHRAYRPCGQECDPDRRVRRAVREGGRNRWDAATEAARLRMRPILMTSLAFILGVVPLVWAVGAGAELRQALGTAVFAGMIGVTVFGLVFTPVFYVICRWLAGLFERAPKHSEAPHPAE